MAPASKPSPLLSTNDEAKSNLNSPGMSARQGTQKCHVGILGDPDGRLTTETVSPQIYPGLSPQLRRKRKIAKTKAPQNAIILSPRGLPVGDYTSNYHMAQDVLLISSLAFVGTPRSNPST